MTTCELLRGHLVLFGQMAIRGLKIQIVLHLDKPVMSVTYVRLLHVDTEVEKHPRCSPYWDLNTVEEEDLEGHRT